MTLDFSTAELLRVARISESAFNQWCRNGRLVLSGAVLPGTGNRRRHIWTDVLQASIAAELSRLGIPPARTGMVWQGCVYPNLHRPDLWIFMAPKPDSSDLLFQIVFEDGDAGFDRDDAPVAFAVLRLRPVFDRVQRELDEIVMSRAAPNPSRSDTR